MSNEYRETVFSAECDIEKAEGDRGTASIQLNPRPFIITSIRHEIIRGEGTPPQQDGLYRISWTLDDQVQFYKGPAPMARSYLGSVETGIWKEWDQPIEAGASQNLIVTIINAMERNEPFRVQVQFHGVEKVR